MPYAHVIGTGAFVPGRVLNNATLEEIVDTSDAWITRRTGIKERHIASAAAGESTAAMAAEAGRRALENAGLAAEDLDLIAVATLTADMLFPSTGCMAQMALGATNAAAYDIGAGCSGFIYALNTVDQAVRCGASRKALVIGVERLSSVTDWTDRGTCVILADGAGAVVIEAREEAGGILSTHIRSDGRFWELLYCPDGNPPVPPMLADVHQKPFHLVMEGNRLFKKAVACMAEVANEALARNGLTTKDIDLIIPHQANLRIIHALAKELGVPKEKAYANIQRYGNTSSATIPIALAEAHRKGMLPPGGHLLLVAFGAGLTWGSAVLKWGV